MANRDSKDKQPAKPKDDKPSPEELDEELEEGLETPFRRAILPPSPNRPSPAGRAGADNRGPVRSLRCRRPRTACGRS